MPANNIELKDAVINLREQLQMAIDEGADEDLRFELLDIEVELKCIVKKEGNVKSSAKFWVVNAEAGAKLGGEAMQTVKLRLKPQLNGDERVVLQDVGPAPA